MPVPATPAVQTPAPADNSANTTPQNPIDAPIETAPEPEVEPWRKVKHKFKAAGEVLEVDYDDLVKRAEKATGAEKRLAEASRKEKEIESKLKRLESIEHIDDDVLNLLGGSERAQNLLEKFVYDKMVAEEEEKKLTPAERTARDEKKRADDAEQKLKDLEEASRSKDKDAQRDAAASMINHEIDLAIAEAEKEGLSPQDVPKFLEDLFENMILHLEYLDDCEKAGTDPDQSPLSPRDVLRKLQDKDSERATSWLKKLAPKDLRALLSDEQLDGLRKSDVEALLAPSTQNRATSSRSKKPDEPVNPFQEPKEPKKRPNTRDWFSAMDNRYERRGR